jgi:NDP-sugar pyrophosphorylase family protein
MIPALVLTAGLATRLRPLSLVRAKAAMPVGGLPLVSRILQQLRDAGIVDVVLNLHHLPASLTSRLGDGSDLGVRIRYSWESPRVLGSAGGPRKALSLLGSPTFLILNGDTLTDLDLPALVTSHQRSGALATLAAVPHAVPQRYGGLTLDAHGNFTGTVARGDARPSLHFIGVQVAEARAFEGLDEDVPADTMRTVYPSLIRQRPDAVRVHECASSFLDIGTPEDYVRTCRAFCPPETALLERGARVSIHPSAVLRDTIVWDDVEIGAGVRLTDAVVTDHVRVPPGSHWDGVILRRPDDARGPHDRQVGELIVTALEHA